jgi:hypothetical protein
MKQETISMQEFEAAMGNRRRAPHGANEALLRGCEKKPVRLTFETEKKAISKLTALYVVRRRLAVQVRIVRKENVLFIGPGEYEPCARRNR